MTALARAVAAHGLRSSLTKPTPTAGQPALDAATFDALLGECAQHRVLGLLGDAVRDGALVVDDDARERLEDELQMWLVRDVRLEQLLLRALDALEVEGIPSRVLKGVALARTAYPRPESRVFRDVDVLVPSAEVGRAVTALERTFGATGERPAFDARFGQEVSLRGDDERALDLHLVFVERAPGRTIRTEDLFAPPYRFPLAGYELAALPMPQRLLHACYAAALGDSPPRLVSLRDVAQIVLRESPHLVDVLMMAEAWRCQLVVARAIRAASDELGLLDRPPIVEWAYRYRPSRNEEAVLAAHERPARHRVDERAHRGADVPPGRVPRAVIPEARWQRRPDVLWRRSLDAVVILPVAGSEPVALAGRGPVLWELLAEPRTTTDMVELLATAYEAPVTEVAADVVPLLEYMAESGALLRAEVQDR